MCFGGSSEPASLATLHRGAVGHVGGVRFRRGRDIDHRLRDRELAFGRPEEIIRVLGGIADHQRLRIGEPDVLHRHAHDAAREIERVLAGIEHAAEIVQRGVRIGAAHRLVQRRDQIVVAVLRSCRRSARAAAPPPATARHRTSRPCAPRARLLRRASARRGRRRPPCARARRARPRRAAASCPRPPRRARAAFRSPPRRANGTPARARATAARR